MARHAPSGCDNIRTEITLTEKRLAAVLPYNERRCLVGRRRKSLELKELQQFGPTLRFVDDPNDRNMGLSFTTCTTLVRLTDQSLWVDSPVVVPPEALELIKKLGRVERAVAATQKDIWCLNQRDALLSGAELWAPKGVLSRREEKELRERYGAEYERYALKTRIFVPIKTRSTTSEGL